MTSTKKDHKKSRESPNERDKKVRDQTGAVATFSSGTLFARTNFLFDHLLLSRFYLPSESH